MSRKHLNIPQSERADAATVKARKDAHAAGLLQRHPVCGCGGAVRLEEKIDPSSAEDPTMPEDHGLPEHTQTIWCVRCGNIVAQTIFGAHIYLKDGSTWLG